ncbi:MAG: cell division protein ZapA [Gammaproteobacteria bacterium]|nr:cell division protein ZapA [Gammaproteobacteria bacterium]
MSSPVSVTILGKDYQIACPEEEKEALLSSARLLNSNMEKIRASGKVVGLDRIAVMAALNIAHDFINLQNKEDHGMEDINRTILQLKEKVSAFLEEDRQLEL